MRKIVGAIHQFHDPAYAEDWARRFTPTAERLRLFETILQQLQNADLTAAHIVELGTGPGYLAEFLLMHLPEISYEGIDFSQPMLAQAAARLTHFADRVHLQQADLLQEEWGTHLSRPAGAVVSTWALHDLGGQAQTAHVYRACAQVLPSGGLLLNGDFVKPEGTHHPFEAGRFPVTRHLELLRDAGFSRAACLLLLEEENEAPTSAQNYACLLAMV